MIHPVLSFLEWIRNLPVILSLVEKECKSNSVPFISGEEWCSSSWLMVFTGDSRFSPLDPEIQYIVSIACGPNPAIRETSLDFCLCLSHHTALQTRHLCIYLAAITMLICWFSNEWILVRLWNLNILSYESLRKLPNWECLIVYSVTCGTVTHWVVRHVLWHVH